MTTTRTDLQRLLAEEPFVRLLARSLVADEADDVVQQAFLQALEHRPGSLVQPRWWLARVVRNLVADHRRRSQRRDARQRAAAVPERVPSSSELLEGEERRRALVTAVDRLSPDQRTVVLLRYYEGLPPRRIAAELRLPVATVWNRLHAALQALRLRLDAEHGGDRRAWLLPLVPFATQPRALPWREVVGPSANPVLWTGVIAMTAKTKFAAAVAAVLVLAGAWAVWPSGGNPEPRLQDNTAQFEPLAAKAEPPAAQADAAPGGPAERAPVSLPEAATKGTLVVHVLHADEPKAAAGLTVSVGPLGDFRVGLQCGVTDATGTVSFSAVAPGKVVVSANRVPSGVLAEVRPGTASECTLQLELGMTVSGIVVDGGGVPIAGAQVEAGMAGVSGVDAMAVAVTAADGTFAVRGISTNCVISARVAGHAASLQQLLLGKRGGTEAVRIVLSAAGGSVAGVVVAADGSAVPGAVVRVGKGRTDCIHPTGWHAEPLPAQVRTDAEGRFLAIGVPVGEQLLMVRAATFAPWSGSCEVAAGLVVPVRVSLSAGVTCTGIVRTEDGVPARSVEVTSGNPGDFAQFRAYSGEDGALT
ncbi:MAG TPA: sigma-70 family RNA polymerase sigma factor, partial [Planctomycetota bacterium]|nr:sigma-70 family RNA polymerase sigma factor [Planctomycetota bacterium]